MRERARLAGMMAGVTVVYILSGILGLSFASVNPAVTPVWPAAGVAVGALLFLGLRAWPALAIGAFITNYLTLHHISASAIIASGNTLEYVVAAALTIQVGRGRLPFERGPDVFRFAFVAAMVAPTIAAGVGTAALEFWQLTPAGGTWKLWLTWWLGDATGVVLYAPLTVLLMTRQPAPRAGRLELLGMALALTLVLFTVFGVPPDLQRDVPLAVLVLPLMLWSAFRVDSRTTAALGAVMSIVAVYRTAHHFGPFDLPQAKALLVVQSIVAVASLMMLAVAAETRVRRRVQSEMRQLNETLERRVHERTAELTRVRNRLVEAQAVAQIGSWEWDVAANELWWSDEMCRIFGVTTAPAGYEPYLLLIHPDDRVHTDAAVQHAIRTGEPYAFEHRIFRSDGEQRVLHARGRVEFDEGGAVRRLLGTGHDITERLRAEEARAELVEEQAKLRDAEETNRAKDAFLATLSHELRTPLNAALGWTHILRSSMQDGDRDGRIVQAIYRNLQLQSRIVSDILDISRIAKGGLPLERERVEMRAVFEAAADMVRESASAKGAGIDIRSAGSPAVLGDSRRLQQVAWNLLSNAVKFAPDCGRVHVSILESGDCVECTVEDNGPGIAPAFLPHVFEQFRQADSSTTREYGGLGLGLAIAHEIVAMHDGTIVAGNRASGGAVFVIRLPKCSIAASADAPMPVSDVREATRPPA